MSALDHRKRSQGEKGCGELEVEGSQKGSQNRLFKFNLHIIEMNHWMESPMRKILLLTIIFSKQPKAPIILKLCSVLLSLFLFYSIFFY